MEFWNEGFANANEDTAHDNGAQNTPEQNAVLIFALNFETAEDNRHDENVIQRQAFFYQKSGVIKHSGFKATLINNEQTKD